MNKESMDMCMYYTRGARWKLSSKIGGLRTKWRKDDMIYIYYEWMQNRDVKRQLW